MRKSGDNPSIYRIRALMSQNHGIMEWFGLEETLQTVRFQPSRHGWGRLHEGRMLKLTQCWGSAPDPTHTHTADPTHVQPEKQHKENSTHRNTNYSQACCCSQVKMKCPKPVIFKMISSPHQVCPCYPAHLYSL